MQVPGVGEVEIMVHNGQVITLGQLKYEPNLRKKFNLFGEGGEIGVSYTNDGWVDYDY